MKRNIFFLVCCLILVYAYQREFAEKTVFGMHNSQTDTQKNSGEENTLSGSSGQYKGIIQIFSDLFEDGSDERSKLVQQINAAFEEEISKYEEEEELPKPKDVSESELLQEFIKFFDCEWEFFPEGTEYDLIINRFTKCIEEGKEKNYIPMLLSVNHTLMTNMAISVESYFNNLPEGVAYRWLDFSAENVKKYRQEMTSSELPDGKQVLNRLKNDKYDSIKNFNDAWTDKNLQYIKSDSVITFPELIINYTGETTDVFIVKIPVKNPWEIFAWLPMGNWNYCPDAEDLMAISKYWYEKHGAIPCAVSYYGIEYRLEKPVSDPQKAFEAAAEMLAFCPDIVGSDLKSVGNLAGTLLNSTIWHFWWD